MIDKKVYEPIIGLEIHVELKTKSKMFCGCPANYFGKKPNSNCCPVCLALPGALPVPNKKAVQWCIMLGLALNCQIPEFSKFDRKNYFYPDLPKGYQISQYDQPLAVNGTLKIDIAGKEKIIRIRRVHMEEDTGKLIHATVNGKKCTLIDFNRSGVPLVEIVTEPDIHSSEEAKVFLKKLHQIIRYLNISDADMEKGSMRLEPNISLNIKGETGLPGYKAEVKNINSFNFTKKAIDYEISRQTEILLKGDIPKQETRGWDEKKSLTYSQRSKEEAHDYRYFPEPDIPPMEFTVNQIENIKKTIPELPDQKITRFEKEYRLPIYDIILLTEDRTASDYFENAVNAAKNQKINIPPKSIANWQINKKIDTTKTTPTDLVKQIQVKMQKTVVSDEELEKAVKTVIEQNGQAAADYKNGKTNVLMYLVGQVMRLIKGQGEPEKIKAFLLKFLV